MKKVDNIPTQFSQLPAISAQIRQNRLYGVKYWSGDFYRIVTH